MVLLRLNISLSSDPISENKLTYDDLKNVILNRILTKEAVPKYEKGLKLDIEVKNVYEHASSFLPLEKTDVNSENDLAISLNMGLCLKTFNQLQTHSRMDLTSTMI